MPIYEYICKDCEKPFEKLVFNSKEKITCPTCGGKHNSMQLSVVATPASAATATTNYNLTASLTQSASQTVNALKLAPAAATTLALGTTTLTIGTGGLLMTGAKAA